MIPRVSIITPIYNEESNIIKCYEQVINQTYNNIEWVVINDGSTDNSFKLLNDLKLLHVNPFVTIKIINQGNAGAAQARKNGIEQATGIFCCILDCDDQLSSDAITLAINEIDKDSDIDIVCFNVDYITNNITLSKFDYKFDHWPISGRDAFKSTIDGWGVSGWFFFKKEIMIKATNDYQLKIGNNINDDEILSRLCLYNSNKISICSGVYGYVNNLCSTTKKTNKYYYKVINTAVYLNDFVINNCIEMKFESITNLVSNLWGVFLRSVRWEKELDNIEDWDTLLKNTISKISKINCISMKHKKASFENIIKILIIKIYLKFR
ncbi:glycosyltransferase family 2 protein [Photobacterium phosphoreum]|uniref:glycosyltransferase family 2 protein n=1 Tax=Photobacterium phosphoreum TaxID=659 RepID=UPI0024BA71A4|nr:glycosyltransferase family A protein [Photobacterium phosphoreum]